VLPDVPNFGRGNSAVTGDDELAILEPALALAAPPAAAAAPAQVPAPAVPTLNRGLAIIFEVAAAAAVGG
jgi:hypothetical protein